MSETEHGHDTSGSEQERPTEIELSQENYESIRIEDGRVVLELTDEAASFLHESGFNGGWFQ